MIKKKAFPNDPGHKHDICDGCSHKFYILQLYNEYKTKVVSKEEALQGLQKQHEEKRVAFQTIRQQYNVEKKEVDGLS